MNSFEPLTRVMAKFVPAHASPCARPEVSRTVATFGEHSLCALGEPCEPREPCEVRSRNTALKFVDNALSMGWCHPTDALAELTFNESQLSPE